MLLRNRTVAGIVAGELDLVFRRWKSARAKAGGRQRTHLGELRIEAVEVVTADAISAQDARRAGYESRDALLAALAGREGAIHRLTVRFAGADPRLALAAQATLSAVERASLAARLARKDRTEAWTDRTLRAIAAGEGTRAAELAAGLGCADLKKLKRRVRQLKELGLTESLRIGYRLSPRGRAWLDGEGAGGP